MRDVSNTGNSSDSVIKPILNVLFRFVKNPVKEIAFLPNWSWVQIIIINVVLAIASGVLSGFIPPNFYKIVGGILISPLVSIVMNVLLSLFLYYYFQIFEYRTVSLRSLFIQTVFAGIPFFIFQAGSELVPPLSVVGFAFTSLLMVVGLVDNFQLEKKRAIRLMGAVLAVVFMVWVWNRIDISRMG